MSDTKNDFDIAKNLFAQLDGLDTDRQHRILRWVAESLGIALHVKNPSSPATIVESPSGDIGGTAPPVAGEYRVTDIKSFVDSKNPKSDVQFAAVVTYYYRFEAPHVARKETITSEILQDSTRLTGRKRLAKPLKTLNNAKTLGYLDSAGRGAFRINTVGENLVAMTLPSPQTETTARPNVSNISRGTKKKRQ
ncbi:MAG: hypothetical protein AUH28_11710 [Acidobacteria bacterium 13_1_40CM_56_16]|nr:MAG: hypothetical protein AUH28_11710 [Acidobacteria bacterium 13_1_40CM_56_16]OLD71918.1 MAG: hypothetical protein AUI45_00410 [Acidobacteria bacterium 13_1_40CM_2_56_11]